MIERKNHPTYDRLVAAAEAKGILPYPAAIARALNESDQVIANWRRRGVSYTGAFKAAQALGISSSWLLLGESQTHDVEPVSNVMPGPRPHGPYPLISEVQAGAWTELCDNFAPGEAEDWITSTKNLGKCGFLLRVTGKSMENPGGRYHFPEGMILHVNPDLDPVPTQFVVVRRESTKQATFKRYVLLEGEPYLEAINPDWPRDMKYMKLQKGDAWCGVVVDASLGGLP